MTTFLDLHRNVRDHLYSNTQVKDKILYLASDATSVATTLVLASVAQAQTVHEGQILELSTETGIANELARVVSVDLTTSTVTVRRAVAGTIAAAWTATTALVRVEPEYPGHKIGQEINNIITGLPPDLWAMRVYTATTDPVAVGYLLPVGAVGVATVRWLAVGPENAWVPVRRWRWDQETRTVNLFSGTEPGQSLKIVYRSYPTALVLAADTLDVTAGLPDTCSQLIQWGALYRLLLARASGRLVDTRAETPLNQQYRQADPVMAAVRAVFALYQERMESERERQKLEYPPQTFYQF